jgi:hypothetical protein
MEFAALPTACDEAQRHCCYQVLITTKQSGRNNRLSSSEGFSFHEKMGS